MTDVDGTFLDFAPAYFDFLASKDWVLPELDPSKRMFQSLGIEPDVSDDYVAEFSEGAFGRSLKVYPDAYTYLKKFKEDGWDIVAITKWHDSLEADKNRVANIERYFGKDFFIDVHCIGLKSDKSPYLAHYVDTYDVSYWVEDHVDWAAKGAKLGATTFLLDRTYNKSWEGLNVFRVNNWLEIYKHSLKIS